jgi:hypothetical protein
MRLVVVCGLGLLLLGLIAAGPLRDAAAQTGTPEAVVETLNYDVAFRDTVLAADQSALSLGDRFILNDLILKEGEAVGHNGGVCTIVDAAGEAMCTAIFSLPEGTIVTAFLNTPPPEKTLAIIGGTGTYQGARGEGTLVEAPDQTGTLTFHLTT